MTGLWPLLTRLGDSSVMLRTGIVIVAWLLLTREWRWPAWLIAAMMLTVASKILYLGFGIGIAAIGFRGFSGHSQMASAILPVLLAGLAPVGKTARAGFVAGMVLALLVGVSRIEVLAHTPSEVIGGLALGYGVCLLAGQRAATRWREAPWWLRLAALLVTVWYAVHFVPAPTQGLIGRIAQALARGLPATL